MTSNALVSSLLIPLLAGAAVGFVGGLITGILATLRWVARRRERGALVPIYTEENNPSPGHVPWRGREHLSRVGWILMLAGVLGLIGGVTGLVQANSTQSCLRAYIQQSSTANQERAAAGAVDRQGIRQQRDAFIEFNQVLIDSITNPATDPAAREQARADFLVKANDWNARLAEVKRLDQEAEAKRQQNPLPAPPDC